MSSSVVLSSVRHLRRILAVQCGQEQSDAQLLSAFVDHRDDSAFAVLVRRHGPMVLGVCRRVLGHEQDAEDAFQATFLVLARRAAALRHKAALGSFLYRTAFHLASTAKRAADRRRKYESQAPPRSSVNACDDWHWREVRSLLDEAIARLPENYRRVFVLCYLENLSQAEAGRRLGLKERTVSNRLAGARTRLQRRLSQRGLDLTAVLAVIAVATPSASALPTVLIASTIKAALATGAGNGLTGVVSAAVTDLVKRSTPAVLLSKTKIAVALILAVGLLSGAGLWACHGRTSHAIAPPPTAAHEGAEKPKPHAPRQEPRPTVEVCGQVRDPDGKPVRGAKLLFLWWGEKLPHKVWSTSDSDGRFRFAVPQAQAANAGWEMPRAAVFVAAAAEGYGFAVARLSKPKAASNLTLRVVKDDVTVRGRVLDLEGRPVAGVRVRVNDLEPLNQAQVYVPQKSDLTDWLAALKTSKKDPWRVEEDYLTGLYSPDFDLLIPPVTTGADGRFRMRGIGRERLVHLRLEGPTIATQIVNVMTRLEEKIRLPLSTFHPRGEAITYHGATFEVLAEPTKPVVGIVRDRDTGKPLAGVTVSPNKITNPWNISNYHAGLIRATTDKDGRYRLVGLPKGEDNQLVATTDDLPYLPLSRKVENTPGLDPATVDFALKRGVWVKGRITEKTTGKPLLGGVSYFGFADNRHVKEIPLVFGGSLGGATRQDGSFRFVVVPGRGLLAVQVQYNNRYLRGVGIEKIKGLRIRPGGENGLEYLQTYPQPCQFESYNTLVEIAPKPGDESITCDLTVTPAAP